MLRCRAPQRCFRGGRSTHVLRSNRHVVVQRQLKTWAAALENDTGVSTAKVDDEVEEKPEFEDAYDVSTLTIDQVHSLIEVVSNETKLAEVTVRLEDLEVRFRRSTADLPAPVAPVAASLPPASLPPASVSPSAPPMLDTQVEEDSYDEPMDFPKVAATATKVGVYHRVRFGGGRALSKKPMVDVGSTVRAGQALGFIEQMGAITAIEAPTNGTIATVCTEEGEVVEFGQPVYEIYQEMASSGSRIK